MKKYLYITGSVLIAFAAIFGTIKVQAYFATNYKADMLKNEAKAAIYLEIARQDECQYIASLRPGCFAGSLGTCQALDSEVSSYHTKYLTDPEGDCRVKHAPLSQATGTDASLFLGDEGRGLPQ